MVNIVGKGRGWWDAPYARGSGEVWGITQILLRRPVDLVIDMNDYSNDRWGRDETVDHEATVELAKHNDIPVILLGTYPYKEVVEEFKCDYFTSTVDYAIALALLWGHRDIDLFGVTLEAGSEYTYQRPGCSFWCGVAAGRGVKITVHDPSSLLRCEKGMIYGYETEQQQGGRVNHGRGD